MIYYYTETNLNAGAKQAKFSIQNNFLLMALFWFLCVVYICVSLNTLLRWEIYVCVRKPHNGGWVILQYDKLVK